MSKSRIIAAAPERIWELIVDPMTPLDDHPFEVQPMGALHGVVGDRWVEQHGPECGNDRVEWEVVTADAPRTYRIRGKQRGITQTSEFFLTEVEGGTLVQDRLIFSPSLVGKFPQQVLPWLLLATGLMPKVLGEDDEFFTLLEHELGLGQDEA